MYVLGKTGTGKSTLLESLMLDDARSDRGFALLDPHGDPAIPVKITECGTYVAKLDHI